MHLTAVTAGEPIKFYYLPRWMSSTYERESGICILESRPSRDGSAYRVLLAGYLKYLEFRNDRYQSPTAERVARPCE
jgi:hypothetical protein